MRIIQVLNGLCRLGCEQLGHECWCCWCRPAFTPRLVAHSFQSDSSLLTPAVQEKGEEPHLHFVYVHILKPTLDPAHCAYLLHYIACIVLLLYFLHHSSICRFLLKYFQYHILGLVKNVLCTLQAAYLELPSAVTPAADLHLVVGSSHR